MVVFSSATTYCDTARVISARGLAGAIVGCEPGDRNAGLHALSLKHGGCFASMQISVRQAYNMVVVSQIGAGDEIFNGIELCRYLRTFVANARPQSQLSLHTSDLILLSQKVAGHRDRESISQRGSRLARGELTWTSRAARIVKHDLRSM